MPRPGDTWTPEQRTKMRETTDRKRGERGDPEALSCDLCSMVHGAVGYRGIVHVLEFILRRPNGTRDAGTITLCRRCYEATAWKRRPRRVRVA